MIENVDTTEKRLQLQKKWGEDILRPGFVLVPTLLFRKQGELGLESGDVVVLLNLLASWWKPEEMPFPKTATLAQRMNVSNRTVQRSLKRLEEKGFIRREREKTKEGHIVKTLYDLSGTVDILQAHAPPPRGSTNEKTT